MRNPTVLYFSLTVCKLDTYLIIWWSRMLEFLPLLLTDLKCTHSFLSSSVSVSYQHSTIWKTVSSELAHSSQLKYYFQPCLFGVEGTNDFYYMYIWNFLLETQEQFYYSLKGKLQGRPAVSLCSCPEKENGGEKGESHAVWVIYHQHRGLPWQQAASWQEGEVYQKSKEAKSTKHT